MSIRTYEAGLLGASFRKPVRGMNRFLALVVSVALGMTVPFGLSAATWQTGDLTNELVVAKGETYTLTAEDAARLGETCFYLTGEGTVVGTKAFAAFTGDVRLSKGVFQLKELGGLGRTMCFVRTLGPFGICRACP